MEQQGQSKTYAPSQDVFISYCTEDRKVAEAIKAFLVSRGFSCWKAPEDVAPGADWPESISQAIQAGRVVVLVWSAASMDSEEVFRELSLASKHNRAIVPVRLEAVEPKQGWDYFLVATQWLDAFPPPPEEHFEKASDSTSPSKISIWATREFLGNLVQRVEGATKKVHRRSLAGKGACN